MSGAHHNGSNRELRAVKMRSTVKEEVRYNYGQELRHIREMRKRLVDRLPQIFATTTKTTTNPHVPGERDIAVTTSTSNAPSDLKTAPTAPALKKGSRRLFGSLAAYLIGLGTLSQGIWFLSEPGDFKYLGGFCTIGRLYIGTGLFTLVLAYRSHLRALGTLLLCGAVAETVEWVVIWNSEFEGNFRVGVPMTGVKGALGWWMVGQ